MAWCADRIALVSCGAPAGNLPNWGLPPARGETHALDLMGAMAVFVCAAARAKDVLPQAMILLR
eukprot:8691599-Alexandrium_andersonii.AAC.1